VSLWNVDAYARLRHGGDDPVLERFAERHVTAGTRVLEVGCGPGRAAAALDRRRGAQVTAVDVSPDMLAAAREIVPPSVELVQAPAEELPFPDGSFDAALTNFAVHLFDRPRAFAEVRRVLRGGAPYWVKTADPERIGEHWAARLFPSFVEIEVSRFPGEDELTAALRAAGFASVDTERMEVEQELTREAAIAQLRGRTFSTMALLAPDELAEGIERAPDVLEDPVRSTSTLLVLTALA
jgi:ubiquinone/menaquinone biosynthesis C-methylase UbiE